MRRFLVALFLFVGCSNPFDFTIDVVYKVVGSAGEVSVTYENEDGGVSQISSVPTPWEYKFEGEEGQFVYISAQNQNASGTVTVIIERDGKSWKSSSSSGAYVIATASGSL